MNLSPRRSATILTVSVAVALATSCGGAGYEGDPSEGSPPSYALPDCGAPDSTVRMVFDVVGLRLVSPNDVDDPFGEISVDLDHMLDACGESDYGAVDNASIDVVSTINDAAIEQGYDLHYGIWSASRGPEACEFVLDVGEEPYCGDVRIESDCGRFVRNTEPVSLWSDTYLVPLHDATVALPVESYGRCVDGARCDDACADGSTCERPVGVLRIVLDNPVMWFDLHTGHPSSFMLTGGVTRRDLIDVLLPDIGNAVGYSVHLDQLEANVDAVFDLSSDEASCDSMSIAIVGTLIAR